MSSNPITSPLQARIHQFISQLADDLVLAPLLNPEDLQAFLHAGFSDLLHAALLKERQLHLQARPDDRANGFCPQRTLHVGLTPVTLQLPRTRAGFYPAALPKHQRYLPHSYQQLLEDILLQAKSFKAAVRTLQDLGLPYSPAQLEELLSDLYLEAKNFNARPLPPDWYFLFIDAKNIHLKDDQDHVRPAVHFLVVGYGPAGKKEVLTAATFWGAEQLECWKKVLLDLKNRGLTRCLLFVTDDFSGLAPLIQSLFPNAQHQLCTVHLHRNALRHLNQQDYALYKQTWREILSCPSYQSGLQKFLALLEQLRARNPAWTQHLQSRAPNYLAFLQYPPCLHPFIYSTNLPEGLNNLIETMKRNAGGHFHSEREALIKMKLLIDHLHHTKWKHQLHRMASARHDLAQLFHHRFETELIP